MEIEGVFGSLSGGIRHPKPLKLVITPSRREIAHVCVRYAFRPPAGPCLPWLCRAHGGPRGRRHAALSPAPKGALGVAGGAVWLVYAGALGYFGVLREPTLIPPGIVILLSPIVLFGVLVLGRSPAGRYLATSLPLALIFALQTFRVGVEVTLNTLHEAGLTSGLLTLAGGNIEILVGISAPLAALVAARGASGRRLAFAWNVLGLVSLLNVAAMAVFTAPGPLNLIHSDLPTLAMGMFPFSFIPGFMAPLAMMLHVLAFRALGVAPVVNLAIVGQARPAAPSGWERPRGDIVRAFKTFCQFGWRLLRHSGAMKVSSPIARQSPPRLFTRRWYFRRVNVVASAATVVTIPLSTSRWKRSLRLQAPS